MSGTEAGTGSGRATSPYDRDTVPYERDTGPVTGPQGRRPDPYGWVVTDGIPTVVARVQAIREGSPDDFDPLAPQPGEAMRILQTFALRRSIDDLLSLEREPQSPATSQTSSEHTWPRLEPRTPQIPDAPQGFEPLDARAVLALAALTRPVKQAAALAIKQWKQEQTAATEPALPPLTGRILHDVTAQRSVQDVAEFVAECRGKRENDLAFRALDAFVETETSGRTSLDKAQLFLALRDEECGAEASYLLAKALRQAGETSRSREAAGSRYRAGIVAALRHLSPSERIVEDWIDGQLKDASREKETIELAANLILGEPEGSRSLAEHIGLTWIPRLLIDLCMSLARARDSGESLVRRHVAARPDNESLAEIIEQWHRSGPLAGGLKGLLADIVAAGAARAEASNPRGIRFLNTLHQVLENRRAPVECRRELRIAAAAHVEGRSGLEVATLLGKVERRDLHRAAQLVNRRLTQRLLTGEIGAADFVSYLSGLREWSTETPALTFWALRELAEPTSLDYYVPGTLAPVIGDIALTLYKQGHDKAGFDLLERCLENEQWLDAADAVTIVGRVRPGLRPGDPRWDALLSATVGRWADTQRRDEVVAALQRQHYDEDATAIIRAVQ